MANHAYDGELPAFRSDGSVLAEPRLDKRDPPNTEIVWTHNASVDTLISPEDRMNFPIPCTTLSTISDLKRGQWAALFTDIGDFQRIRYATPVPNGCVRVEWDHGPGTRATVRVMPGTNPVQVRWA